jgi:hypothetical protein
MNEIITPTNNPDQSQQHTNQPTQPTQPPIASIEIQVPPLQVDMNKVVRLLFDKIRRLEERLQALEQPPQNRTPH